MNESTSILSPDGQRRRQRILELAVQAAGKRRRRSVALRAGSVCLALCAAGIAALHLHRTPPKPRLAVKNGSPADQTLPTRSSPRIALIPTDPTIVKRLSIPAPPAHVVIIHDRELLEGLAAAHQPAGLAYVNGKATLIFRSSGPEPSLR
jgi:hypothetical protein